MNHPPEESVHVPAPRLHAFVAAAARQAGLNDKRADLLARLLTDNDLRGVFSHGTQQIATYARLMRDGRLNPDPDLKVVRQTPVSVLIDGDGGLGYFPAYEGTCQILDKAAEIGMGAMVSRNHGHFGAAGIYARLAVERGMICYVTSGHQLDLQPAGPIVSAGGGSPMAFAAPAGDEEPLLLDFGAMHDLYDDGLRDLLAERAPGLVLRTIGMGEVCQAWGGLLSGLGIDAENPSWDWPGANQGSLVVVLRPDLFTDTEVFKAEMDEYIRRIRALAPLPGFDSTHIPGGIEAERHGLFSRDGVPVGRWHRERLEKLAQEFDLQVPWD
jgi:L-2-hydroxycarboxylate dehydrogenase (NAD+)